MPNHLPQRLLTIRIESLHVKNYRVLHDLDLKGITPLTVFLGPNGSGKSTIFDVFAFLSECFSAGLRSAWDKRGRFKELRTRGSAGPIQIELSYTESSDSRLITYHLSINEGIAGPFVARSGSNGAEDRRESPSGSSISRTEKARLSPETSPTKKKRIHEELTSSDVLAVSTLGQLAKHPRISALRRFITGWYLSYLTADATRGVPEAGAQERLSETGDNLPNVIQYLKEQHEGRLAEILKTLSDRVPRLERVESHFMPDGRLLLQIKDAPFEQPILAKFASDGTLKMLAYLTLLYDPKPPELIGIEEPENHLHPRLLPELAEECRMAAERTQLMVTTHSPFFVNGLRPEELWVLYRDEQGYTQARRAADMKGIPEFVKEGASLGELWMEGYFEVGDPLTASGGPKRYASRRASEKV